MLEKSGGKTLEGMKNKVEAADETRHILMVSTADDSDSYDMAGYRINAVHIADIALGLMKKLPVELRIMVALQLEEYSSDEPEPQSQGDSTIN